MGAVVGRAIFQVVVVLAAVGIVALACMAVRAPMRRRVSGPRHFDRFRGLLIPSKGVRSRH